MWFIMVHDYQYVVETLQEDLSQTDYFPGMLHETDYGFELFLRAYLFIQSHITVVRVVKVCLVVGVIPWPLN